MTTVLDPRLPTLNDLSFPDTREMLEEEKANEERLLPPAKRAFLKKVREWKARQPLMTFRLIPGAGHHVQLDPDGIERQYKAIDSLPILSPLNLSEQWPEKFQRVDSYNTASDNPYLNVPAPGELPEEFKARMERLKASGAQVQVPHLPVASQLDNRDVEVGVQPKPSETRTDLDVPASAATQHTPFVPPQKPATVEDNFDKMTVAQLKKWAEDREITLSPNLNDKAKLIVDIKRGLDRK